MTEVAKVGIKDLLEIIGLGLQITIDITESFADDGKFTWSDSFNFRDSILLVPGALEGVENVWAQAKDIDSDELLEIKNFILKNGSAIPGVESKWLQIAEHSLNAGMEIYKGYKLIKG